MFELVSKSRQGESVGFEVVPGQGERYKRTDWQCGNVSYWF